MPGKIGTSIVSLLAILVPASIKKEKILKTFLIIAAAMFTFSATATVCMPDSAGSYETNWKGGFGVMWSAIPKINGNEVLIVGLAACSSHECIGKSGHFADCAGNKCRCNSDGLGNSTGYGSRCHCRQIFPRMGYWVWSGGWSDAAGCMRDCDQACGNRFMVNQDFRNAILSL